MSDQPPEKKCPVGIPAWVMTFADLMSLLMCFFVLLLSFSEMDVSKYKQLAGSMANAFGVQREIKVKEPPKGINIIAREFSPGRPEPTPMNVVKQQTTMELRIHLDVGQDKRSKRTPKARYDPRSVRTINSEDPGKQKGDTADAEKQGSQGQQSAGQDPSDPGKPQAGAASDQGPAQGSGGSNTLDDATAAEIMEARLAQEQRLKLEANAQKISAALQDQIEGGAVDVEREGQKIIIRIREKASFGSGTADIIGKFKPVLWRLGEIIENTEGKIIVVGHTDDIPISTRRFRSNWELSAGRASSVLHELLWQTAIPLERFMVQGHGQTQPLAPNDSNANRSKNRRVEIILMQGEDQEAKQEITQRGEVDKPAPAILPKVEEKSAVESDDADTAQAKPMVEDNAAATVAASPLAADAQGVLDAAPESAPSALPDAIVTDSKDREVKARNSLVGADAPRAAVSSGVSAGAPRAAVSSGVSAGAPRAAVSSGVSAGAASGAKSFRQGSE